MLNMASYEKQLATLWFDRVTATRTSEIVDDTTGATEITDFTVVENDKCRISYSTYDNPAQILNTANEIDHQLKFFTYYNSDIKAGDRCTVYRTDRDGVTVLQSYSGLVGESNLYRSHKEILLNNVKYIIEE